MEKSSPGSHFECVQTVGITEETLENNSVKAFKSDIDPWDFTKKNPP